MNHQTLADLAAQAEACGDTCDRDDCPTCGPAQDWPAFHHWPPHGSEQACAEGHCVRCGLEQEQAEKEQL